MITLLAKVFIKPGDGDQRQKYGVLCSMTGIFLNIILFTGKYFAGLISGSIAIMADAFNNLSDAGSSFITLIGFKFAGKKPDPHHPFGHGRFEYISGLIVSMAILLMGVELGKSSVEKIFLPQPIDTGFLAMGILICSILVKMYMAFYNTRIGSRIDSSAMKATAMDSLSDCVATTVVLIAMLIMRFTGKNVDGIGGLLVAAFILYAGVQAAKETINPLLGQPPEKEFTEKIEKIVLAHKQICGIHDLVVHDYGPGRCIISLHAEVPGSDNIYEIHDTIDNIEKELHSKLDCEAVIHMDPIETDNKVVSELREQVAEKIRKLDARITIHDFRVVQGETHTNLIFDAVFPYDLKETDEEMERRIEEEVHKLSEKYCTVITIDHAFV